MIYLAPLLRLFADPGVEALARVGVRLFPFPKGDAAGEAGWLLCPSLLPHPSSPVSQTSTTPLGTVTYCPVPLLLLPGT